jgi:tetratricopeptide (TPR) repeat protein
MVKYSINAVCFEGICRIYRNSCVRHIRTILKRRYPEDYDKQIKRLFKDEEWQAITRDAEMLRKTGEIESPLVDGIDILGVNHFYNVFESYFDDLFSSTVSLPEEVKKAQKQAILAWTRHIKKLRDPALGHPGEEDLSRDDGLVLLDAAKRILRLFDETSAAKVAALMDAVIAQEAVPITSDVVIRKLDVGTLPPRETYAPNFIGREAEIGLLMEWVQDPERRLWLLAGGGGKGKTAIAYEFASRVCANAPENLEMVIWLSAKKRKFFSGQAIEAKADFNDLASALDVVLSAYGEPTKQTSPEEKKSKVREYLDMLPAIIILDDVDSLEGTGLEALTFFMFELAKTRSKLLLTSRRVTHFGMEPITTQVEGFAPASKDGFDFVTSRVKMFNLDASLFPSKLIQQIIKACDGSPLFIEDLLRLCCHGESTERAINVWRTQDGEAARGYALGREYESLSTDAKKVLLACALYEGAVSVADISVAISMSHSKVMEAIKELQSIFLVPKPRLIEQEPRFALNINTRQLVLAVQKDTDLARTVEKCIAVANEKLPHTPSQRSQIGQYIRQAVSLVKLDRHSQAEATLIGGLEAFPESAELHGNLGWVYKQWSPPSRFVDARREFQRAAELKGKKVDMYVHWSQMESDDNEWTRAAEAAETGLKVLPGNLQLGLLAGSARLRLGKNLVSQAQNDRADQEFRKAERLLRSVLGEPESAEVGEYSLRSHVYRALVLTYEQLVKSTNIPKKGRTNAVRDRLIRLLSEALTAWNAEHPDDEYARTELHRLVAHFPELEDGAHRPPKATQK